MEIFTPKPLQSVTSLSTKTSISIYSSFNTVDHNQKMCDNTDKGSQDDCVVILK